MSAGNDAKHAGHIKFPAGKLVMGLRFISKWLDFVGF